MQVSSAFMLREIRVQLSADDVIVRQLFSSLAVLHLRILFARVMLAINLNLTLFLSVPAWIISNQTF